jgi:hypothetical protein
MSTFRIMASALLLSAASFGQTGPEAFTTLRRLSGEWEAKTARGLVINLSYRLIAGNSAIVETFTTASGFETLTIYHLDGQNLVATHYCAQGNQPRLRLEPGSTKTMLGFAFHDVTNLSSPSASHMTRLRLEIKDADHFDKTEVYTGQGKENTTVFNFVRVPKAR